jgi:hypothetical protein
MACMWLGANATRRSQRASHTSRLCGCWRTARRMATIMQNELQRRKRNETGRRKSSQQRGQGSHAELLQVSQTAAALHSANNQERDTVWCDGRRRFCRGEKEGQPLGEAAGVEHASALQGRTSYGRNSLAGITRRRQEHLGHDVRAMRAHRPCRCTLKT